MDDQTTGEKKLKKKEEGIKKQGVRDQGGWTRSPYGVREGGMARGTTGSYKWKGKIIGQGGRDLQAIKEGKFARYV